MDVSQDGLQTLATVLRAGTFEAAAAELHVTPSAISQRIKAMEHSIGRVLVQRTKPVRATRDGEVLLRLAEQWELLATEARLELTGVTSDGAHDDQPLVHLPIAANADCTEPVGGRCPLPASTRPASRRATALRSTLPPTE